MKLFLAVVSMLLLLIPFQNCSMVTAPQERDEATSSSQNSSSVTLPGDPIYAKQSQSILIRKCSGCHGSMGQGGVNNISDLAGLVQQGLIIPQDPDSSSVIASIQSGAMPPSGTAVNSGEVGTLRAWIMSLQVTIPPTTTTTLPPNNPPTTTTTTLPPPPPSTNLMCQIVATPSSNIVPGDSITLKLTWSKFTIAPTSAVLDGIGYSATNQTSINANSIITANKTITASVTGSEGTANCQLSVTVKATSALTKDEFFRAKVGPGGLSVNDLVEKKCASCHNSSGSYANMPYQGVTYYQLASQHMQVVKGNSNTNLNALRNALNHALTTKVDLTSSASSPNLGTMASGHKTVVPLSTAEANHAKAYVAMP